MVKRSKTAKPRRPRGSWGALKPIQKPHSTPKGKRGYTRKPGKRGLDGDE